VSSAGLALGACRVTMGLLAVAAIATRLVEGFGDPTFSVADFLSYFTIQSNVLAAMVLLGVGAGALRGRPPSRRLDMWRGAATLYMATTGVAYSVLLAADEPSLFRWTNLVLHYVMPVALVADWAIDRPRWTIPFRRALAWMAFPAAFIAYTLIRGAILDWYPYPFVDVVERGYSTVLLTVLVLGAAMLASIWLLVRSTRPRTVALKSTSSLDLPPMAIVVYEKRTCTTCRKLAQLLAERGIDFERVEYHVEGLDEPEIRDLLAKTGVSAADLLRTREEGAHELAEVADEDTIVAAMAARPQLLQRPIVVNGDRAVLARPVERVLEIL
jgi:arsenate reductase (glutaredoxin)